MDALLLLLILILVYLFYKKEIKSYCKKNTIKLKFTVIYFINKQKISIGEQKMIQMSIIQYVEVVLNPVDRFGNPAGVENVVWTSSDSSILEVTPDPNDELRCKVRAVGAPGTAQVDVSADADLGDGVVTISDFLGVEVRPELATGLGLVVGEPQDQ